MKKIATFIKPLLIGSLVSTMMLTNTAQAKNLKPKIKKDAPHRYTIKKGDTLWKISNRYLHNPSSWKKIWATNKQIKNPHRIYPGDVLIMCVIKGETLIGVDTGKGCSGIEKQVTGKVKKQVTKEVKQPQPAAINNTQQAPQYRPVMLRPMSESIPAIPTHAIRDWLTKIRIVNPYDFDDTPYVLASKNRNLITAKGDTIYVKGAILHVGQSYGVYKKGQPFTDPVTNAVTGIEVTQVAEGRVTDVSTNGVSTIKLTDTFGAEVKEGDRVFGGMSSDLPPRFSMQPSSVRRGGLIIRISDSVGVAAGARSVVAINLGGRLGARAGDVLTAYRRGPLVRDVFDDNVPVRLPSEPSGRIMIFRVFDDVSYAYVLDASVPLSVGDQLLSAAPSF